jgi:hypothetical protein
MSNRLAILAAEIRAAHEAACQAHADAAQRVVDAGRALFEAKSSDDIPRGGWERWVEDVAGVPWSTARRYVQLFNAVEQGALTVADIAASGQKAVHKLAAAEETRLHREASRGAVELADGMDLRIGDARDTLADIADNSVPLILTDPPYGDEAEPLYRWLAQWAARVLIPGGSLICYTGQSRLDRDIGIFGEHLRYWWLLAMLHTQSQQLPGKFVLCEFKPVLWYVKAHRRGRTLLPDVLRPPSPDKELHAWGQAEGGVHYLIEHLTEPGETIVDPFAGTAEWGRVAASMGRRWIGADIAMGGTETVAAE